MITILNLISDTNIGGAGRVILNYLKYTDRARFRTLVAVPWGSALIGPLKEAGAEAPRRWTPWPTRSYSKEDVKVLTDFIRRVKPDLVHTHGCLSGRIAAKKCGLPVVYSRHSAFPVPAKLKYPPGRWVNRWLNQHYADRIIAVSPATMDNLVESGVSPKRITVVMNGVAPLTATTPEEQTALKKNWASVRIRWCLEFWPASRSIRPRPGLLRRPAAEDPGPGLQGSGSRHRPVGGGTGSAGPGTGCGGRDAPFGIPVRRGRAAVRFGCAAQRLLRYRGHFHRPAGGDEPV